MELNTEDRGVESLNCDRNSKDLVLYSKKSENSEDLSQKQFWNSINQGINLLVGLYEGIHSACTAANASQSDILTEITFDEGKQYNVGRSGLFGLDLGSNDASTTNTTRIPSLINMSDYLSAISSKSSSLHDLSYINMNNSNNYALNRNVLNDPSIQLPHSDVPDLSTHTKMYATRSHISLSILCSKNIDKIIETSIICGDFKLKGPGFRVENVYIPIRSEKQIVEIKLTTFNNNGKRDDLVIEVPLTAIHENGSEYKFWLSLSSAKDKYSNDYNDILPEAVFRLKILNGNSVCEDMNCPRILVSLKRTMSGIIRDTNLNKSNSLNDISSPNFKNKNSNDSYSLIYVGLYTDPVDIELSHILNSNPTFLENNIIEKLNNIDNQYKINNIQVKISYGTGSLSNTLLVQDDTSRQPLIDYLNNTNDNIEWFSNEPTNATELVPSGILPDFTGTPAPWEVENDRRKAMELACHRVALREHIALQYLMDTGYTSLPKPKFSKWLNPPYFRIGPQYHPVPMSYNWGPNYTNIQLIPLEKPRKIS
ncbi:hypothetical protein FG386_000063 [Cryptosporidium ryanae]|uniref:uncharacterized protein n=1 Tax=Cryptosporidium ryanae TaxID=515981 RepID=UPI00351A1E79|nr:hypothetical protein FG386_000063 [Cryptosporidium ryanae]